jgi:hypothetical protein
MIVVASSAFLIFSEASDDVVAISLSRAVRPKAKAVTN